MQQIAEGIFSETGYIGCNVSCVKTDDGVLLVDTPQRPSDALDWRVKAEQLGPIRYQVNTEHHPDHIMGNWFFREAIFVAHEGTRRRFRERVPSLEGWKHRVVDIDPEGAAHMEGFDFREPDVVFTDRMTIYLGGREIQFIHKVGHTENQAMVYVPDAKALLPGDNVVENWPPLFHSAVPESWIACLDFIEGMDVDVITPGHGAVCDKSALDPLREAIKELVAELREAIESGATRDEALALRTYVLKWESIQQAGPDFYVDLAADGIGRLYDMLKACSPDN